MAATAQPHVAIACGGSGGHFFPGVAVGRELAKANARVTLIVSEKSIDQRAAAQTEFTFTQIPAAGFSLGSPLKFLSSLKAATSAVRSFFQAEPPQAVLAMGGFTSFAPIRAGRQLGAATFLHESNAIPGRANRLIARWADEIFIGLDPARAKFSHACITQTGTPVREDFRLGTYEEARKDMDMANDRPLVVVTGGSQGARGLNRLVTASLPHIKSNAQWLHLCGPHDLDEIRAAHQHTGGAVHDFFDNMPLALRAADLVLSRAGASSLAELAAANCPAILMPLPSAADDHQRANARVAVESGAALAVEQDVLSGEAFAAQVDELLADAGQLKKMSAAMAALDHPNAAQQIAGKILRACEKGGVDRAA